MIERESIDIPEIPQQAARYISFTRVLKSVRGQQVQRARWMKTFTALRVCFRQIIARLTLMHLHRWCAMAARLRAN